MITQQYTGDKKEKRHAVTVYGKDRIENSDDWNIPGSCEKVTHECSDMIQRT